MDRNLEIKAGTNYLSEAMGELPKNCLFDKGKVGCGGTTIALTNSENYVIAVPFVSLIENKLKQHTNILGVFKGGSTATEIKEYVNGQGKKKIMVTYDSLPALLNYINPNEYNLLIDEYHLLFTQYSFRKKAAQAVLKNYLSFKSFCFMTATVLEEEFIIDELKGINTVVANWKDVATVVVNSVKCQGRVDGAVIQLIKEHLTGEKEGNAYIFVNSVEFIKDMVRKCKLTEKNCRVIYSKNNKTKVGIENGNTIDCKTNPKKINLLTSTAFEGSDIYDENGKTYIVSDGKMNFTLTDISTSFQQIAGRIRNSQYWSSISHLYTTTRYSRDITYNDFKTEVEILIENGKKTIIEFNALSASTREMITAEANLYIYKNSEENFLEFDPNLVKIDLYNFKITNNLYSRKINITNACINSGYSVVEHNSSIEEEITRVDKLANKFQETVEQLVVYQKNEFIVDPHLEERQEYYRAACARYPFLSDAINIMGYEGIAKMDYHVTNIKREVIKKIDSTKLSKVVKLLATQYQIKKGYFISAKDAKSIIQGIYNELGITKSPNIKDYYNVKTATKWINGNVVKGYVIIMPKMIVKE